MSVRRSMFGDDLNDPPISSGTTMICLAPGDIDTVSFASSQRCVNVALRVGIPDSRGFWRPIDAGFAKASSGAHAHCMTVVPDECVLLSNGALRQDVLHDDLSTDESMADLLSTELLLFVVLGFFAQLIDGALGMAYGL